MRFVALAGLFVNCDSKPAYDDADIARARLLDGFDRSFLLGAATAAHQVEGGLENDWTAWETGSFADGQPHVHDRSTSARAADSWNRWADDVDALRTLGANAYRMGVEWSRLQPAAGAALDAAAVARYRQMLSALRAAGIEPVVTVYHFTLPAWSAGWESDTTIAELGDFAQRVAAAFGDLVDWWVTLNEPNVLATQGWLAGVWPPGKKGDTVTMAQVFARLMKGHARIAAALRAGDTIDADSDGRPVRLGLAHHVRIFEPATSSPLDVLVTALTDDFFNAGAPDAIHTGRVRVSVPGAVEIDEAVEGLRGSADFLGINYYTRDFLRADLGDPALSRQYTPEDRPKNDLGWDIFPEGFERSLVRFARYGLPLLVTENGTSEKDDARRARFLRAHLYALGRAHGRIDVPIVGYLHWSLLDNFEWAEGYQGHFGLFAVEGLGTVDGSLQRVAKPDSVAVFQEAARNIGLQPR